MKMARTQLSFCYYINRHLVLFLLFFLVSSSTLVRFSAEGRAMTKLHEASAQNVVKNEVVARKSLIIGSRPPRCERICGNCGHCEAIQVPVNTQTHKKRLSSSMASIAYSRGDDISNYKPMSWKCKCGNFIINP